MCMCVFVYAYQEQKRGEAIFYTIRGYILYIYIYLEIYFQQKLFCHDTEPLLLKYVQNLSRISIFL